MNTLPTTAAIHSSGTYTLELYMKCASVPRSHANVTTEAAL